MTLESKFSTENFSHKILDNLKNIINIILSKGFTLTLVGGCIRDYLLTGNLSDDFDFEIRSCEKTQSQDFFNKYESLMINLQDDFQAEIGPLPFSIYRVKINNCEIEISVPRVDSYESREQPKKHSEFNVTLEPNLDYSKSFLRRDFTINSMGVLIINKCLAENMTFVDPYDGETDLTNNNLNSHNPDFYLDPVRLLRMLRFKSKFNLNLDSSLQLNQFNLQELTFYYVESEYNKLKNGTFFELIWSTINDHQVAVSNELREIEFLKEKPLETGLSLKEAIIKLYENSEISEAQLLKLTSLLAWKKRPMLEIVKQKK